MIGSPNSGPGAHPAIASRTKPRALSDICEATESTIADTLSRDILVGTPLHCSSPTEMSPASHDATKQCHSNDARNVENVEPESRNSVESDGLRYVHRGRSSETPSSPNPIDCNNRTKTSSVSASNVPPRSSSKFRARSVSRTRKTQQIPPQSIIRSTTAETLNMVQARPLSPSTSRTSIIPNHGQSQSPVRLTAARFNPVAHDTNRRIPSKTFIRQSLPKELLEHPAHSHPRIQLGLDLSAGVFVGGGCIEGTVQIDIDDAERVRHKRTLDIAQISIDLLGIEEASGNRRAVFLSLATELINKENPPPQNMVDTQQSIGPENTFWHLVPSTTNLAFSLSLPLDVGPPPFYSKNARIRYLLYASLLIRDRSKRHLVRTSEDVTVLPVYDPEKALVSLPSPLNASDEWIRPRDTTVEIIRLTAGIHRQVWVSGTNIFVDVYIVNNSHKTVKKIVLQLERDILCYKHAAASTMEKSAGQARIFDSNERTILSKAMVKNGSAGWHGVAAGQTHLRTCDLEVPRGHATVKCGKYFEVRYFLNVIVCSAHTRLVTVQLPIVLIHMNSLDVVPNSVTQVALAIEEKRTSHHSPPRLSRHASRSVQGRAFAAPRTESLKRIRDQDETIQELGRTLEQSPRKYNLRRANSNFDYRTLPTTTHDRNLGHGKVAEIQDRLRRIRSNDVVGSKYPTTLQRIHSASLRQGAGSALGFRESEICDDTGLGELDSSGEGLLGARLDGVNERPYWFSKRKSFEKWKDVANLGVGWLKSG
ncbi:hypothetical protein COCC4DRAFT_126977 [Bipolaris maydis ATCC 48331]|uniref:Arrestin C-terminal-like domain-containing protein n=1 Tax=Cochliobolus heterostrophus (strain C4 / ATCC 48331 / race T) TaxID=665024 RepID=N4XCC9_COCH4|nr:uncharacterized protein COCC4DRAFT_126977 [Bipolaris maydis ATCC 48331]KAH7555420.1 hypothetical protein BM1_07043 [Bipolaris maydis]ENI09325.1 hypothetical protein COCC4DRAFT_126977 [Bipolaris maydis ATCC 48331]KAJ5023715.1 hypothetical protein J3E73DRAFT_216869 [Bipolaris maydis]KAJ6206369.1 hypothetical protein PSV09DRAFT_2223893 [Bipolaris maydis]KAJ6269079.1 hypothetical protein PSV08DRAFT_206051 [Bipolaris maydis]